MPNFQASNNREQREKYQFKSNDIAFEIYGMHYGIRVEEDEILPLYQDNWVRAYSDAQNISEYIRYKDIISCSLTHTADEGECEIQIKPSVWDKIIKSYKLWDYALERVYNFNGTEVRRVFFFTGFERSVTGGENDEEVIIIKLANFEKYILARKIAVSNQYIWPLPEEEPYNFNKVKFTKTPFPSFVRTMYDINIFSPQYLGINSRDNTSASTTRELRGFFGPSFELNSKDMPNVQFIKEPDYIHKLFLEYYNASDSVKYPRIRLDLIKQSFQDEINRDCFKINITYEQTQDFELSFPNDYRVLEFKEVWDKSESYTYQSIQTLDYPEYSNNNIYPATAGFGGPKPTTAEEITTSDAEIGDAGSDDRYALGREKAREYKLISEKSVNLELRSLTYIQDVDINSILTLNDFPFSKDEQLQYAVREITETFSNEESYLTFDITKLEEVLYDN